MEATPYFLELLYKILIVFGFIALIFFCSMICFGFYAACGFEGDDDFDKMPPEKQRKFKFVTHDQIHDKTIEKEKMIFWFVRFYLAPIVGRYWSKPIYRCPACMGSLHSILPTYLFLSYLNFPPNDFFILWPFVALATCGTNWYLDSLNNG